jgi:hypothetical protein
MNDNGGMMARSGRHQRSRFADRSFAFGPVLDQSQSTAKYSSATDLHNQGAPVLINATTTVYVTSEQKKRMTAVAGFWAKASR